MKKILKYSLFVLFIAGMLCSCMNKNTRKNNYPAPDITEPAEGQVFTISELVDMVLISGNIDYKNDTIFKKDCSIYGIITDDEVSGNLYKAAFVQERETGKGIELYMKAVTGLRIGDSVRVCLKDAVLGAYKGTPQIQNLDPKSVIVLANCKYIEPASVTITQINDENKVGQLVRLENVQFRAADTLKNWAEESTYGERMLQQFVKVGESWVLEGSEIMVRSSNFASFADKPLPKGNGYLTAIVTKYKTTWQLVVRGISADEVLMDGPRK